MYRLQPILLYDVQGVSKNMGIKRQIQIRLCLELAIICNQNINNQIFNSSRQKIFGLQLS